MTKKQAQIILTIIESDLRKKLKREVTHADMLPEIEALELEIKQGKISDPDIAMILLSST